MQAAGLPGEKGNGMSVDSKAQIVDLPSRRAAKILDFIHSEALRRAVDRAVEEAIRNCLEHRAVEVASECFAGMEKAVKPAVVIPFSEIEKSRGN